MVNKINEFNADLPSQFRNEKYDLMEVSAFRFFRATAHLFYEDLGTDSRLSSFGNTEQTRTWICGDMHVANIGAFSNDDGQVVFDVNDFDESVIADYQLDVWRMAVSIKLMMLDINEGSASDRDKRMDNFVEKYLDAIEDFASDNSENSLTVTKSSTSGDSPDILHDFLDDVEDNEGRGELLSEMTEIVNGARVFKQQADNPDLGQVPPSEKQDVINAMGSSKYGATLSGGISYSSSHFHVKDVVYRLHAGGGSLGTLRYYVLIQGPSGSSNDDVILDVKEQGSPSPFLNLHTTSKSLTQASISAHHGKRTVLGYKSMAYKADDYLGWTDIGSIQFSVRERNPYKKKFKVEDLTSQTKIKYMAKKWGTILATAHSRADEDSGSSSINHDFDEAVKNKIDGFHASFRANVHAAIDDYVLQIQQDYNTFKAARAAGDLNM